MSKEFMPRDQYIEFLSLKTNEVHMTNQNRKTGMNCWNIAMPISTCREDVPCRPENGGTCYCCKDCQNMARTVACYVRNLRIYRTDRDGYWEQVAFKLKHTPLPYFRYNDAGEIPDYEYIDGMVALARKFPSIKFLCYTKKYELVNEWLDNNGGISAIPENLCIRFSTWDKTWEVPNPYNLPMAWVHFKNDLLNPEIPEKAAKCSNQIDKNIKCGGCGICFNKTIHDIVFEQH